MGFTPTILDIAAIFIGIIAVGMIFVWNTKRKNKKQGIPVVIFIPESGNVRIKVITGYRIYVNTQVRLDLPAINRQFDFPAPYRFTNGVIYYIQVDAVTYKPLILINEDTFPLDIKNIEKKIFNNEELNESEQNAIRNYINTSTQEGVISPAFAAIYEKNIEKVVKATRITTTTMWDKIKDLMPIISVIIGVIAIIMVVQAFSNGSLSGLATTISQGLQIHCPPINQVINITNSTLTPPPI